MKNMKLIIFLQKISLITLIAFFTMSCTSEPYTSKDNGSTVNLSVDDPFEIQLVTNSSTGYKWQVAQLNNTVIKQIGKPVYEIKEGSAIGASGLVTFKFQTVANGQADLRLEYVRGFEENETPSKTFEIKIVVGTMGRILED